uniref:Uncharacterized protein n=1 Tax=Knipowitschia caucasica TaxID=637954 RepID=A0AAV2KTB9_KNICA
MFMSFVDVAQRPLHCSSNETGAIHSQTIRRRYNKARPLDGRLTDLYPSALSSAPFCLSSGNATKAPATAERGLAGDQGDEKGDLIIHGGW